MARTSVILIAALLVLLAAALEAEAATCKVTELQPCMSAFQGGRPTKQCCNKLKEQRPCLCEYMKDPTLKKYVDSPQAKNIAKTCGMPYPPKC